MIGLIVPLILLQLFFWSC